MSKLNTYVLAKLGTGFPSRTFPVGFSQRDFLSEISHWDFLGGIYPSEIPSSRWDSKLGKRGPRLDRQVSKLDRVFPSLGKSNPSQAWSRSNLGIPTAKLGINSRFTLEQAPSLGTPRQAWNIMRDTSQACLGSLSKLGKSTAKLGTARRISPSHRLTISPSNIPTSGQVHSSVGLGQWVR